ncbi:hypothetical protein PoB_000850500 [Plakobranchus ocellatus]|uniref:Uncharacterized protein n=1 Tax=Plakobranchus ocellatus TaxID=259542 RepID=A0AAV3YHK9_9GAST|nr:hypothetical protein PoB_000850500 [Plakobranchus ocellatus]
MEFEPHTVQRDRRTSHSKWKGNGYLAQGGRCFYQALLEGQQSPSGPVADARVRRLKKALERRPTASNRKFEVEFTETELDIALRKGKTGKAPGLDGITQEMLAHLGPSGKEPCSNCSITRGEAENCRAPVTNPEERQMLDGGRNLPFDLAHICDKQDHGAYGERSAASLP